MIKKIIIGILLLAAIAIIAINFFEEDAQPVDTSSSSANAQDESLTEGLSVGQAAPDFTLTDQNGETVKLSDYQGKKVILNFWATWCPPCRAEMPHMQEFHENNADGDVEVLAVNLTAQDNGDEAIQSFIDQFGLTFSIPMDETGSTAQTYQIRTVPTTYILNTKGEIAQKIVGPMDEQIMKEQTDSID
ncbi:TlpA family protein disulfide reductase [Planococcus sp. CP5-4]|uniref:peroxiredoxin family protein n=1 Tax=unclassified Planococcus (in: firmicutes) TaxID=2662419 RepID=UPI001C22128E|nr:MULTISPECIES: TlpA disulfide reductase family protein [unclassified Planococcus (in: firmicutes)]MBU9674395.1 TlpA family protein disulfide reductase [Planococcus sp. CP5-4_YE]MBV0909017.1 TlpA family protein disulfide reductase [Planococcus sp. CP5-4_UN]MBW6065087.1 TlpA family protein disulfide reductase [Planococcus sp. CP5-4]